MFKRDNTVEKIVSIGGGEPRVFFTPLAMAKIKTMVDEVSDEVGWLMPVQEGDNGVYLIYDLFVLEQEVNGATCEIKPEALSHLAQEVLSLENGVNIYNSIKCWGHSHVNMTVTPSGQDNQQMMEFVGDNDYFIRIIANKKGSMKLDFYDYKSNIAYENIPYQVYYDIDQEELEVLKGEIKEKVKKKKSTYVSTGKSAYGGYRGYGTYNEIDDVYEIGAVTVGEETFMIGDVSVRESDLDQDTALFFIEMTFTHNEIEDMADMSGIEVKKYVNNLLGMNIKYDTAITIQDACIDYVFYSEVELEDENGGDKNEYKLY